MRLNSDSPVLSFDVESIGLHGEGFAVGIVAARDRKIEAEYVFWCDPKIAHGDDAGHQWVKENIPPFETVTCDTADFHEMCLTSIEQVRGAFWNVWEKYKKLGYQLLADVSWPVEANFLSACIQDAPDTRAWNGPYPMLDVSSISALTTLESPQRLPSELPLHHPLMDARHSLRSLWEALETLPYEFT